jgi:hypothetical protein
LDDETRVTGILFGYVVSALLLALGLRVHLHARRVGGLPDRMIGIFFMCLGLGAIPALIGSGADWISEDWDQLARGLGHTTMSVGYAALAVFAWRCFGPNSAVRRALAFGVVATLAGLLVAHGVVDGFRDGEVVRATSLARGFVLAWAFAESLHYRNQLRRRLALGIADALVTNRFTLWCLWTGSLLGTNLVMIGVRWVLPDFEAASPLLQAAIRISMCVLGLTAVGSLFLAFFPPARYVQRVRASAPV